MISEQEAREAADRIKNGGGDAFACWEDYQESSQKDDDVEIASAWIVQELARREAERAERAKPIDNEWLLSIGFQGGAPYYKMRVAFRHVRWSVNTGFVSYLGAELRHITTRGQLLDLLAALKGGES